jgi:hypothetical protein
MTPNRACPALSPLSFLGFDQIAELLRQRRAAYDFFEITLGARARAQQVGVSPARLTGGWSVEEIEKLARCDHPDALVRAKGKQVLVASDDVVRTRMKRAGDDHVVIGSLSTTCT